VGQGNFWILGGAIGVDDMALRYLQEQGEDYIVIVPDTLEVQKTKHNTQAGKDALEKAAKAGKVREMKAGYTGRSLYARNIAMLEYPADELFGFPNCACPPVQSHGGTGSGTWNCILEARKRSITRRVKKGWENYSKGNFDINM
jgi:hypothetical protein